MSDKYPLMHRIQNILREEGVPAMDKAISDLSPDEHAQLSNEISEWQYGIDKDVREVMYIDILNASHHPSFKAHLN